MSSKSIPEHLSPEARLWWKEVLAAYSLEPHHTKLLQAACEALHGVQTDENSPANDFAFDLEGGTFNPATPVDVDQQLGGGGSFPILGNIAYENADGSEVTVDFAMDINGTSNCVLTGTAIGG